MAPQRCRGVAPAGTTGDLRAAALLHRDHRALPGGPGPGAGQGRPGAGRVGPPQDQFDRTEVGRRRHPGGDRVPAYRPPGRGRADPHAAPDPRRRPAHHHARLGPGRRGRGRRRRPGRARAGPAAVLVGRRGHRGSGGTEGGQPPAGAARLAGHDDRRHRASGRHPAVRRAPLGVRAAARPPDPAADRSCRPERAEVAVAPNSVGAQVAAIVLAIVIAIDLAMVWSRVRDWWGWLVPSVALFLCAATALAAAGIWANRQLNLFTTWSEVAGHRPVAPVAGQTTIDQELPSGSRVVAFNETGPHSGISLAAKAYLPPGYDSPTGLRTHYPVIEALAGFPVRRTCGW